MRLYFLKYREKGIIAPISLLLCFFLLSGIVIKYRITLINNYEYKPDKTFVQVVNKLEKVLPTLQLPILVLACSGHSLRRTMETISVFRNDKDTFPIIIAPYCRSMITSSIIRTYTKIDSTISFLRKPKFVNGTRHYKFTLNYIFRELKYEAVIVLEDDLDIAPDFFEYFQGTYPLLKNDSSIWCVSAWNDNCKEGLVDLSQPQLLHRTEFFPGMGWMLLSETWDEIEPRIPGESVEEYFYKPAIVRGRVCIRPEISRTFSFMISNWSKDPYERSHRILNTEFISFTRLNYTYLLKAQENKFVSYIDTFPKTTVENLQMGKVNKSSRFVQIPYSNSEMFKKVAKTLGLMDEIRHGVPRTGLRGIVQCYFKNRRVFLTPIRI